MPKKKVAAAGITKIMRKAAAEKEILSPFIKVDILSGEASPTPPLGPLLGQRGINIAAFCKDFNNKTSLLKPGIPLECAINVNPDRSYMLRIGQPPAEYLLMQAAGMRDHMMPDEKKPCAYITCKHIYEIAKVRQKDYYEQLRSLQEICQSLMYLADNLGIKVVTEIDREECEHLLKDRKLRIDAYLQEMQEIMEAKLLRKG